MRYRTEITEVLEVALLLPRAHQQRHPRLGLALAALPANVARVYDDVGVVVVRRLEVDAAVEADGGGRGRRGEGRQVHVTLRWLMLLEDLKILNYRHTDCTVIRCHTTYHVGITITRGKVQYRDFESFRG